MEQILSDGIEPPSGCRQWIPPSRERAASCGWMREAMDERHPLLERVKFLSIFFTNLDEFFMIRVSGLMEQVESGLTEPSEDGLTPHEQLAEVRQRAHGLCVMAEEFWEKKILPELQ